jgi:hypothetical protein
MPKKDTAAAVVGMLSSVGAQTRPITAAEPIPAPASSPVSEPVPAPTVVVSDARPTASVSSLAAPPMSKNAADEAPRTLRLRADTAQRLRAAWLEAKRDDVLLTAQDFASNLVEEALNRRRRQRAAGSN